MDADSKAGCLKSLQGKIWEAGYRSGQLKGQVFEDVPAAFERWRQEGRGIAIYSSGSVQAQRLIFGHAEVGDLSGFISHYFDTAVGPKREASSYARIAADLGADPAEVLFATDVYQEAEAGRQAGMQVVLLLRPGNPAPGPHPFPTAVDFVMV